MGYFMEEEEIWKCKKHSKRRPIGICHICLRERLARLCPDCATEKPCSCSLTAASSSSLSASTSSSTSASSFSGKSSGESNGEGTGDRMANLIEKEPKFQRSRSTAFPFLRSRFSVRESRLPPLVPATPPPTTASLRSSFWPVFKSSNKSVKKSGISPGKSEMASVDAKMMRSKTVGSGEAARIKGQKWYFPSPIKVFTRHSHHNSRTPKVLVQDMSPLCRG